MNIALCDDDLDIIRRLKEETSKIFRELKEVVQIYTFTSGVSLLASIEEDCKNFDVLL